MAWQQFALAQNHLGDSDCQAAFWQEVLRPLSTPQSFQSLSLFQEDYGALLLPHSPMKACPELTVETLGIFYEALSIAAKQQGLFYTPRVLVDYLVERTLGRMLQEQSQAIQAAYTAGQHAEIEKRLTQVQSWRIVDPACGCGIFLLKALHCLHQFYQEVAAFLPPRTSGLLHGARYAFTYQLYGVDLDPIAVALAEWSLLQTVEALDEAPCPLIPGASNLAVGDALVELQAVSAEGLAERLRQKGLQEIGSLEAFPSQKSYPEAFSWEGTFPEVPSWDFVIGNPPYITEVRKQSQLFQTLRTHSRIAKRYQAKMDLSDAFLLLGLELLRPGGQLAMVLPAYWTHRTASQGLRESLWHEGSIQELWTFDDTPVFPRAPGHHTSLLIYQHRPTPAPLLPPEVLRPLALGRGDATCLETGLFPTQVQTAEILYCPTSGKLHYGPMEEMALLAELTALPQRLLQSQEIQQGLVLPQGTLNHSDWERLPADIQQKTHPGQGIFLLSEEEIDALGLSVTERALLRPYYSPHPFLPFQGFPTTKPGCWVLYGDQGAKHLIASEPANYPRLREHLDQFQTIQTSAHRPYGLHRARQPHWFEDPRKILSLRQTDRPAFAMVAHPAYINESFYILCPAEAWLSRETMVGILNSTLAWFWFSKHKVKGKRLQVDKDVLLTVPAPPQVSEEKASLLSEIESVIQKRSVEKNLEALDNAIYQLYGLSSEAIRVLEGFKQDLSSDPKTPIPCSL